MYFQLVVGVLYLFFFALICALSSFAIILKRERELVALLFIVLPMVVTVNVL